VKVLVVGSGGREHALVRAISRSPRLTELHAAPGNPGIAGLASCHPARADDPASIVPLAIELGVDLVVVGPEAPLVVGLADKLRSRGVAVFGPSAEAARIEGSKTFAKEVMDAAGVPSARVLDEARAPCVVKADGLTAGKGVWVCHTQAELDGALRAVEALAQPFHVEEVLEGGEVSVFALCDGSRALPLASAQDYKRVGDGDAGPNTGGMGAFSPRLSADEVSAIVQSVHMPVLAELARRRTPFLGTLYAGLMLTEDGPRVLEFNCRFGDPETQVVLPLVEGDLLEALAAAAAGDVRGVATAPSGRSAVVVVLAGRDYPERSDSGTPIEGTEAAERTGALVLHAATALHDGHLVTDGGRILNVVAIADTVAGARAAAYDAVAHIDFAGMRYRTDIASDA
jgi:phosphoribosylamine--glycine ligase